MGKATQKLILVLQLLLVTVGAVSLLFGVFTLVGNWISRGF
ncbi:MAG: hypothetical protein WA735_19970 [Candidatus Acidiferrales bacterium]